MRVGIKSHAYVAETSKQAAEEFFPSYAESDKNRQKAWLAPYINATI
jgi:hypothetical protein